MTVATAVLPIVALLPVIKFLVVLPHVEKLYYSKFLVSNKPYIF